LTVQADNGYLKVHGETHVGGSVYAINRLFALPTDAIIDKANAVHQNGMLTFTIPRRAADTEALTTAAATTPLPATTPMPSMVRAAASAPTSESVAPAGPSPIPRCSLSASSEAGHSFVLTECEADATNVQAPLEAMEELLVDNPPANLQPCLVDGHETGAVESMSYNAGYARALEDVMKYEPEDGADIDEAELTDASVDDNGVAKAATDTNEMMAAPSELPETEWMDEWDTLLTDLEEMGFDDRSSNRSALSKHGGQMKPTVRHLVSARASSD